MSKSVGVFFCLVLASALACSSGTDESQPKTASVTVGPVDTALYVSASYQLRVVALDRAGDTVPGSRIHYGSLDPSVASVSAAGVVSGSAFGRSRIVASSDAVSDTVWLSVVPQGRVAMGNMVSDPTSVNLFNLDGSGHQTLVGSGQGGGAAPAWLPTGTQVAFQYQVPGGGGSARLYLSDLAGNASPLLPAASGFDDEKYPRFSSDGQWIYFRTSLIGMGGEIWRIKPTGDSLQQVGESATFYTGDTEPDPSPDRTKLALSTNRLSPATQVVIRDIATGVEDTIGAPGLLPRWSPAGDWIAYWDWDQSSFHGTLHLVHPDGTGNHLVSPPGRQYRSDGLDWSADGQWLIARTDDLVELVNVTSGLVLPLPYTADYNWASWER